MPQLQTADVVVVGGGLSGVVAADELLAGGGREVVVLEGAARLGGRLRTETVTVPLGGAAVEVPYDCGGCWVGATHHGLRALLDELGAALETQHHAGLKVMDLLGGIGTYTGHIPTCLGPGELLDMHRALSEVERLARRVDAGAPQLSDLAERLDGLSVAEWCRAQVRSPRVALLFHGVVHALFAASAKTVSMLHFLNYAASSGGLDPMIKCDGGHQHYRIVGGTGGVLRKLAARVEARGGAIRLGHAVDKVTYIPAEEDWVDGAVEEAEMARSAGVGGRAVEVSGRDAATGEPFCYRARYVIIAASPKVVCRRISFEPELSPFRTELMERCFMGSISKAVVFYDTAFWRAKGFSGEVIADAAQGPVFNVLDYTQQVGEHTAPALVAFWNGEDGRFAGTLDPAERRKLVLAQLERWFGPEAQRPIAYRESSWTNDRAVGGGPIGIYPPGVLSEHGHTRHRPTMHGRLLWAGTEAADAFQGFMAGAVEAGRAAAKRVRGALEGVPITKDAPKAWEPREKASEVPRGGANGSTTMQLVGILFALVGLATIAYALYMLYTDVANSRGGDTVWMGGQEYRVENQECDGSDVYEQLAEEGY